jgi:transcriptional regulator with XRE-family HTH domain
MHAPAGPKSPPPPTPQLVEPTPEPDFVLTQGSHVRHIEVKPAGAAVVPPRHNPGRLTSRPELERFRANLLRAMTERNLTSSQLAREIWGTTTDTRGYKVARNRDRIAHYLAGTGYPTAPVLEKMAQVLGVDPAQFAKDEVAATTGNNTPSSEARVAQRLGVSMNILTPVGGPPVAQLTLHHPISLTAAGEIIRIYTEALAELDRRAIEAGQATGENQDTKP